jgi:hypothetical protein
LARALSLVDAPMVGVMPVVTAVGGLVRQNARGREVLRDLLRSGLDGLVVEFRLGNWPRGDRS